MVRHSSLLLEKIQIIWFRVFRNWRKCVFQTHTLDLCILYSSFVILNLFFLILQPFFFSHSLLFTDQLSDSFILSTYVLRTVHYVLSFRYTESFGQWGEVNCRKLKEPPQQSI